MMPSVDNVDSVIGSLQGVLDRWHAKDVLAVNLDHLYTRKELARDVAESGNPKP